jgi:hypothetical protein
MRYRSLTHLALRVPELRQAESLYVALFDAEVLFREAEVQGEWRTLPEGAGWADAEAAGITLQLSLLRRDVLVLALEQANQQELPPGRLSHVGLRVSEPELERLRVQAGTLGCQIVTDRPALLVLDDPLGLRWEITTASELESSGIGAGRWLQVQPHPPRSRQQTGSGAEESTLG